MRVIFNDLLVLNIFASRPISHAQIGGIKEKVLAAVRAGKTTIILPKGNERAAKLKLPIEVQRKISLFFCDTIEQVLSIAIKNYTGALVQSKL